MHRTFRTAVVTGLACAATLLPAVAHADRWSAPDERGDVTGWHYDPEPEPCGTSTVVDAPTDTNDDITRLRVRHNRSQVRLRARFRDLDPALMQMATFYIDTERRSWMLSIDAWRNAAGKSRVFAFLARQPKEPDPGKGDECGNYGIIIPAVTCRIDRAVDVDADLLTVTVPRSCLRDPRWVRVGLDAFSYVESQDPADPENPAYTFFSDEWGSSIDAGGWIPPYGPRVRAPRGAPSVSPAAASNRSGERRAFTVTSEGLRPR